MGKLIGITVIILAIFMMAMEAGAANYSYPKENDLNTVRDISYDLMVATEDLYFTARDFEQYDTDGNWTPQAAIERVEDLYNTSISFNKTIAAKETKTFLTSGSFQDLKHSYNTSRESMYDLDKRYYFIEKIQRVHRLFNSLDYYYSGYWGKISVVHEPVDYSTQFYWYSDNSWHPRPHWHYHHYYASNWNWFYYAGIWHIGLNFSLSYWNWHGKRYHLSHYKFPQYPRFYKAPRYGHWFYRQHRNSYPTARVGKHFWRPAKSKAWRYSRRSKDRLKHLPQKRPIRNRHVAYNPGKKWQNRGFHRSDPKENGRNKRAEVRTPGKKRLSERRTNHNNARGRAVPETSKRNVDRSKERNRGSDQKRATWPVKRPDKKDKRVVTNPGKSPERQVRNNNGNSNVNKNRNKRRTVSNPGNKRYSGQDRVIGKKKNNGKKRRTTIKPSAPRNRNSSASRQRGERANSGQQNKKTGKRFSRARL